MDDLITCDQEADCIGSEQECNILRVGQGDAG